MPDINLSALDAALLADLAQQVKDGLITKAEAVRLAAMINWNEKKEGGK